MSRPRSLRDPKRPLLALALLTAAAGLGTLSSTTVASANTATDPNAAVTYQLNPAHDGGYAGSFVDPLRRSWSVDLKGTVGYPVIADGRVFVTVAHPSSYGDDIEALSLTTGDVLWGPKTIAGTYHSGMLAYDDGRVFTINFDGRMTAFDAATGAQQWITQLPGQYAFTSPPTAVGGTVYVGGAGSGGTLYAVDEATGDVTWTAGVMNGDDSSPAVGDGGVFVSYACEQTYRFGLDGSLTWHHDTACEGGGGRTSVLHGGDLYVRDDAGMSPAILDGTTGDLLGSFSSSTAPAFDGTFMATESGGVLAVWDTDTGTRLWSSSSGNNVTAPLIANGYVVEGRSDGTVELRREQDGTLAWSGSAGTEILPTDEHNAGKLIGLALGDGALAVPAGNRLTVFVPLGDAFVAITGGPGQQQVVGPDVTFTFSSNVANAEYACTLDGFASPCTSPVDYQGLQGGGHTFSVALAGSTTGTGTRAFTVDASPPTVRLGSFHPILTHQATATIHWSAADPSGIGAYQLRIKRTRRGTSMPSWTLRQPTTATSATLRLRPDTRLCVALRATDGVGNWSSWTPRQCVVRLRG